MCALEEYRKRGWSFDFDDYGLPDSGFITMSHPSGGKQTVCQLTQRTYVNSELRDAITATIISALKGAT
jgi:hypothetical protein